MKKILLILMLLAIIVGSAGAITYDEDNYKKYKANSLTAFGNDPIFNFIGEISDIMEGDSTTTIDSLLFSLEAADPCDTTEGRIYYNSVSEAFVYRDSDSWNTIAAETGTVSLDVAYGNGVAITVDNGAVALTATDAASNVVFSIEQQDTGALNAMTLTGDATFPLIDLDQDGSGGDIEGSDASWSVSKVGAFVINGSITLSTADVHFDGTSAAEDVVYDSSADMMHFLDAAILGFGGAAGGAADIVLEFTGGTNTLDITGDGKTIIIGATGAGLDVKIWGQTGNYVIFDEDADTLTVVDYDIWLDDTSDFFIGGTKNVGFLLASDGSKAMSILAGANSDDFVFNIGVDQSGIDVGMYGTTASAKLLFDSGNDALIFDAIDIHLGDEDVIQFGDSTDAVLSYDATKNQLEYRELTTGDEAKFQIVGGEGKEGRLILGADDDDEATDQWEIAASTSGTLTIGNDATADVFTDYLTITHTTGLLTLKEGESISNNTDDSIILTSNDENMTLLILGHANAKSAILDLTADAGNDNVDTWTHTVADGGAYTIANEGTATMTVAEAMDITGTITLADDELLSNASDVVDITGDDAATTFAIRGATGNFAGILEISADDAADNADTWLFSVADGGAMTVSNDGTATMTISEAVTITGVTTVGGFVIVDELVTNAAMTLTAAMSGKIIIIGDLAGNTLIDLPVEADGLNYEFWYTGDATEVQDHTIDTESAGNNFVGGVQWINSGDDTHTEVYSNGTTHAKLVLNNLQTGSIVKLTCDGSEWYIYGVVYSDTTPSFETQ